MRTLGVGLFLAIYLLHSSFCRAADNLDQVSDIIVVYMPSADYEQGGLTVFNLFGNFFANIVVPEAKKKNLRIRLLNFDKIKADKNLDARPKVEGFAQPTTFYSPELIKREIFRAGSAADKKSWLVIATHGLQDKKGNQTDTILGLGENTLNFSNLSPILTPEHFSGVSLETCSALNDTVRTSNIPTICASQGNDTSNVGASAALQLLTKFISAKEPSTLSAIAEQNLEELRRRGKVYTSNGRDSKVLFQGSKFEIVDDLENPVSFCLENHLLPGMKFKAGSQFSKWMMPKLKPPADWQLEENQPTLECLADGTLKRISEECFASEPTLNLDELGKNPCESQLIKSLENKKYEAEVLKEQCSAIQTEVEYLKALGVSQLGKYCLQGCVSQDGFPERNGALFYPGQCALDGSGLACQVATPNRLSFHAKCCGSNDNAHFSMAEGKCQFHCIDSQTKKAVKKGECFSLKSGAFLVARSTLVDKNVQLNYSKETVPRIDLLFAGENWSMPNEYKKLKSWISAPIYSCGDRSSGEYPGYSKACCDKFPEYAMSEAPVGYSFGSYSSFTKVSACVWKTGTDDSSPQSPPESH